MGEIDRTNRRRRRRRGRGTEERLARWRARTTLGVRLREQWEEKYQVKELERYFLGQQQPNQEGDRDAVWLNRFFSTLQAQKPALMPREVMFQVAPKAGRQPFGRIEAKTQEGLLRAISEGNDNHLTYEARLALAQAFFRVGCLKTIYDPQFEPNPRAGEPLVETVEGTGNVPTEPNEVLTDEVYTWDWVDAKTLIFPDEGPSPRRWSWIAEEITITLDEAKRDERFPRNLRNQFVANASADESLRLTTGKIRLDQPGDREAARFKYIEAWDIKNKRTVAWADGQPFETFILDEDYKPGIDDRPYSILAFVPILGPQTSPWPMPLIYNWLPIQREFNTLGEQSITAGKRAARKYLYDVNTFPDTEEVDKFNSNVDMQGVMVSDLNRPPAMFGESSLNLDVTRNLAFLDNIWNIISGVSGDRLNNPDTDTATEAVLVAQSSNLRDSDLRSMVDQWLAEAGSRMLQLVKQTLELDIWVQLKGFTDSDFREFMTSQGFQSILALQFGPENVQNVMQAIQASPRLQESFRERFGTLRPLKVTRSELQFEADVRVLPNSSRPIQQAAMVRMAAGLPTIIATGSPTLLEDYIESFELTSSDQIVEEITLTIRNAQQALQQQQAGGGNQVRLPQPGAAGQAPLTQAGGQGRLGL